MPTHPNRFRRAERLSGKLQFAGVYDAKTKTTAGPLLVFSRPNGLPHDRLGLSVSRRVGIAVQRTRIKRLIREAFRLRTAAETELRCDWVIVVRPHVAGSLVEYQAWMASASKRVQAAWEKRQPTTEP